MPLMLRIRAPIPTLAKTRCMARKTSPNYSVSHLSVNSGRCVKNALEKIQSNSPTGASVPKISPRAKRMVGLPSSRVLYSLCRVYNSIVNLSTGSAPCC